MKEPTEHSENEILEETFELPSREDSEDSLFDEDEPKHSSSSEIITDSENDYEYYYDTDDDEFDYESEAEEEGEYNPGDLVSLRGLFEEDGDNSNTDGTTLDFEEIPDDIDIDEPIEVEEKLTRVGRILDATVRAALVIFGILVIAFLINVILFAGAVLSTTPEQRIFVNISDLDKEFAEIDVTVLTEGQSFGRFIRAELEKDIPIKLGIYLQDDPENLQYDNQIAHVSYEIPKDEKINYNGGERDIINLKSIKLKLNQDFDASRLSGFMEPRSGTQFHERYPRKVILDVNANIVLLSFWIPIPCPISYKIQVNMDSIDESSEQKKLKMMKEFDFNPKFVDIKHLVATDEHKEDKLVINLRQPVPKFYAPPFVELAVHLPEMTFNVRQFTMEDAFSLTPIEQLFKDSRPLMVAKVKPSRMILTDEDMSPNILDVEAIIHSSDREGLMNVLKAFRDAENLKALAFLLTSEYLFPSGMSEKVKDKFQSETNHLVRFMRGFWARQAYPVGDGSGPELPSVPELYDPVKDSAIEVTFNGLNSVNDNSAPKLSFDIAANTHYVISEYKFPLLMLSGQLPSLDFKIVQFDMKTKTIARFKVSHVNDQKDPENPEVNPSRPIGEHIVFNIEFEFDDLEYFTKFGLKASRMLEASKLENQSNTPFSMKDLIGSVFDDIEGIEIVADHDPKFKNTWISSLASVFDMRIASNGENIGFVYIGNDKAVLNTSETPKEVKAYSAKDEEKVKASLAKILEIDLEDIRSDLKSTVTPEEYFKTCLGAKIKLIRENVQREEFNFFEASRSNKNFTEAAEKVGKERIKNNPKTTGEYLRFINSKESALDEHKKIMEVRSLLHEWILLRKAASASIDEPKNNLGVYCKLDSDKQKKDEMTATIGLALPVSQKVYDDNFLIRWKNFEMGISDVENNPIVSFSFSRNYFEYSLTSGQFYGSNLSSIIIKTIFVASGNQYSSGKMSSLKKFYNDITDSKKCFLPIILSFKDADTNAGYVSLKGILPAAGIPPVGSILPKVTLTGPKSNPEPRFFDNLSKSYFDFIGYGFSRLIFNAILPNPKKCPTGKSIINVEIDLPPTTSFIFAEAKSDNLYSKKCIAAINTGRPLKIWTQIIDGVVCNMYSVAIGIEEQEIAIQGRVSRERSKEIVKSFSPVIQLRKRYIQNPSPVSEKYEPALMRHFRNKKSETSDVSRTKKHLIPLEKRIALVTAIPINIEILNFDFMMKIIDKFSDKVPTTFTIDDPTIEKGLRGHDEPSLLNSVIGALASNFPIQFNTQEKMDRKVEDSEAIKHIHVDSGKKLVLKIDTHSSSPNEMTVKTHIFTAQIDDDEDKELASRKEKEIELIEEKTGKKPYNPYESLSPELHFVHPIIRWGRTVLRLAFPKFIVELKLAAGDIKITEDGDKIIFDQLQNFKIELSVKGRAEKSRASDATKHRALHHVKEIFRATSIRQILKRCGDFINQPSLNSGTEPNDVIETTSSVSFGPAATQKFHFFGSANSNSFFILQRVIINKMFSGPKPGADYNPKEDPTFMDFSMLISLGGKRDHLPMFTMPCFFTNFCSAEQLDYSNFNKRELLENGPIPTKLHVRNTFQPLTQSIAAGFVTLLSIFHMETYPSVLQWNLNIPKDQVIGMEMNGQMMFYGKTGPLSIEKKAHIPYPNALESETKKRKSFKVVKSKASEIESSSETVTESSPTSSETEIKYENADDFDTEFFETKLFDDFSDEVIIPMLAQVPESLPKVLRNLNWPLFFMPIETWTLHPPLINIKDNEFTELGHAPIAIAISDAVIYRERGEDGKDKLIKPSLLTKLFAAFMEESSSTGLEMHKVTKPSKSTETLELIDPSCFRFHYTYNYSLWSLLPGGKNDLVNAVIWLQFPWAMGPIGFDFGKKIRFYLYLPNSSKDLIAQGEMSKMHFSGTVARMRIDLNVPPKCFTLISAIYGNLKMVQEYITKNFAKLTDIIAPKKVDTPLKIVFHIDENFSVVSEAVIPEKLSGTQENLSTMFGQVKLTSTSGNIDSVLKLYREKAPQAVACVFKDTEIKHKSNVHYALWRRLDLAMTRVYYRETLQAIKPKVPVQIFLQLRTAEQVAICGTPKGISGVAVMIEYVRPEIPFEVLFDKSITFANPPKKYYETIFDPSTSVYMIIEKGKEHISFEYTGRYRIYAALLREKKDEDLKKLTYKGIKFTEIYVQNGR